MSLIDPTWTPAARLTDPETSHEAEALLVGRVSWCRRIMHALATRDGSTTTDVSVWLAYGNDSVPPENVIARRLSDLRSMGYAEVKTDAEGGPVSREGGSGRRQQVWVLTSEGREVLA